MKTLLLALLASACGGGSNIDFPRNDAGEVCISCYCHGLCVNLPEGFDCCEGKADGKGGSR